MSRLKSACDRMEAALVREEVEGTIIDALAEQLTELDLKEGKHALFSAGMETSTKARSDREYNRHPLTRLFVRSDFNGFDRSYRGVAA